MLSNPKSGSWSTTRSAGAILARRRYLSLRKLSVQIKLSASLRSHTLMVSELALMAGVGGTTIVGRGALPVESRRHRVAPGFQEAVPIVRH